MSYIITVNYELTNGTSPMPVAKYVHALDTNPETIEEGGTATLNFVADGFYFVLQRLKAVAVKVTGATSNWSCADPYTTARLTLSNPTSDVAVTIKVKTNVVPQEVSKPFLIQKNFPIDTRLVLTKKEMIEADDLAMPETYFALCKEDGHFYLYNKKNEATIETGKFTLITDGSTSGSGLPVDFLIQDPNHNQILIYDKDAEKWINKDLTDEESIIYLDDDSKGLSIKGYKEASQGFMLVKDAEKGISWTKPLTTDQLQSYTSAAYESAQKAGASAVNAGNAAVQAETAKTEAKFINEATMAHINDKFWWGSIEEYNALDHINAGSFHFITLDSTDVEE